MRELLLGGSSRRLGRAPHFFRGGADSVPAIPAAWVGDSD